MKQLTMETHQHPKEPTREQIEQAVLVLLKAQVALKEMQLAGKTEWEIKSKPIRFF